ncbi:dihydrolipoamide acetyltransferase family protein [Cohaesibacter gelatinilyticus]|uniref:Dihydrolipoamide acetyltransferase component of pyruvate dehydrogenase complex n=1 Tax=Cohaesibacter gelatinilyticus TaxID=372072 RepID=A0A285PM91_9HYPH|nr:dihydrolipoamide acetyltransferase family protein [Cohaesibacter gelatinilyticus]SNZ21001.1 branched-chain alpha-keto acid dehydrogenase E2 component [Cohaesibacter gelatinilyticus]
MAKHIIKMPDVGEGITEAEIVEWEVKVGDFVNEDDVLAAVMTDKATVEIPSPVTGTILSLTGELGEMTAVGAEIIAIQVDGEGNVDAEDDVCAPAPAAGSEKPAIQDENKSEIADKKVSSEPSSAMTKPSSVPATPVAAAHSIVPTQGLPRAVGEKPLASPSVRRRALEAGIRLAYIRGTGPAGRILHEDLDAYIVSSGQGAMVQPVVTSAMQARHEVDEYKVIGLRRKIAERMQDSKSRIPHISYVEEVDVTDLEKLRVHMNDTRKEGDPKLTILPFIMRAMVLAIAENPKLSSHFDDRENVVRQYAACHIGMAAQTDGGLMVPVVRHAEARSVRDLAAETKRLADVARDGSITRDELTGSTITLSSLGALGGIVSTPVINSPEVAIVGVNKIQIQPVHMDGVFVPRKIMNLSSSFDHRIIDGWDAAVFIQKIKSLLEHPATLFVD